MQATLGQGRAKRTDVGQAGAMDRPSKRLRMGSEVSAIEVHRNHIQLGEGSPGRILTATNDDCGAGRRSARRLPKRGDASRRKVKLARFEAVHADCVATNCLGSTGSKRELRTRQTYLHARPRQSLQVSRTQGVTRLTAVGRKPPYTHMHSPHNIGLLHKDAVHPDIGTSLTRASRRRSHCDSQSGQGSQLELPLPSPK